MSPIRRVKAKIGELLLQKGMITLEQLQYALSLQRTSHKTKPLGQILVELGYVNKEEFYAILAVQSGYPYINIEQCRIKPEVLSLIPEVMSRKHQIFPIDQIHDILTIAMANPLDKVVVEEVKKLTKFEVRIFLTTPLELGEIFAKYYEKNKPDKEDGE